MALRKFKLGLIQLAVGSCKADNLSRVALKVKEAAQKGAQLIALPECCNSPYGNEYFPKYAEKIPGGESTEAFAKMAKENKVFLVAGSIPEIEGHNLFNTCTVFNPEGDLLETFRKVHLFDIDIPGKITFQESKTLSPGNELVTFDTPFCKVGLGICYDVRFPEFTQAYAKKGVDLMLFPGAFNMTTGPAHWKLLARARALDNQLYVGLVSPARDNDASYKAWGHSVVVGPWGDILEEVDENEHTMITDIDLNRMEEVRKQIPVREQRRTHLITI